MSGFVDDLSEEQQAALRTLRAWPDLDITHPRFTDSLLLRFLRAQSFNVRLTAEALRKHLVFRAERHLDEPCGGNPFGPGPALECFPEMLLLKSLYPHGFHKMDRKGRPVYIERIGCMDLVRLAREMNPPERMVEYFSYQAERQTMHRLPACSIACGRLVETSLTILDLQGLKASVWPSVNMLAIRILKLIAKEQETHFPEVSGNFLIVNAPTIFSMVWAAVKPMISSGLRQKMELYCHGHAGVKERLLELVAPENLPEFLGGSCACPEGCLCHDPGPWQDPAIAQELQTTPPWEVIDRFTAALRQMSKGEVNIPPLQTEVYEGSPSAKDGGSKVQVKSPVARSATLVAEPLIQDKEPLSGNESSSAMWCFTCC